MFVCEYKDTKKSYCFRIVRNFSTPDLYFLGINPSFSNELRSHTIPFSFASYTSFRVLGEPALSDTFPLFKKLQYAPHTRATYNTKNGAANLVFHKQRKRDKGDTEYQECPPCLHAKVVLRLYNNRMERTNHKERCNRYNKSRKIHGSFSLFSPYGDDFRKLQFLIFQRNCSFI